ncbi:hypothetical protein HYS28_00005 [Candidatus Uhrbacteria bacterium]|nr:hypothetical protein [Candidatus Uhrbacteria bacterium]
MSSASRFAASLSLLALAGGGCLSLGGSSADVSDGGLWVSDDGGSGWTQFAALPGQFSVGSISAVDILAIEVDPQDDSAYYVGTSGDGLLYSYDAGATWQRPEEALARSGAILDIEVDPRDVCTYYVLKTDRVMKTTTCGRTFMTEMYVESRADEDLTDFVIDWYNPNTLYMTTTAGDVIRSTDGGESWATIYRVNDELSGIMVSNTDSRILLAGSRRHGIYRSTDAGANWTELEDTLKETYRQSDNFYDFAQTADGKTLYMSSEYGLLVSKDQGGTWSDVPLITARGEVDILALAVDPADGNTVMYGTDSTFYRSTSGGSAWTTEELPSSRQAAALRVHPANSDLILLGLYQEED